MKLSNILSFDFAKILSYGLPGLCVIFILLAYLLLRKEQDQKTPRSSILKAIYVFLSSTFVMAIIVGVFSLPILSTNDSLQKAVNIADEVNVGFKKISTTDSIVLAALKSENIYLKEQLSETNGTSNPTIDKENLADLVENQQKVLTDFDAKISISQDQDPRLKSLQTRTVALMKKIDNSDFEDMNSQSKSQILKEVNVLNSQTIDFSKSIKIAEKNKLFKNLQKYDSIQKTIKN